jgi:phospholipase C
MADLKRDVDTVVIVLMENRSFDHMLGYLGLPPYSRNIEGLQIKDDPRFANPYNEQSYLPYHSVRLDMPHDPPHERLWIKEQIGSLIGGSRSMNGFVQSYYMNGKLPGPELGVTPEVMGYFTPAELPVTDFFAQKFTVCDHWFSSIPASTQPNRLMAMAGYTLIDGNADVLKDQYLVYDWLNDHRVNWRVYHEGIPFFALMPRVVPQLLSSHFRGLDQLANDFREESDATFPDVIFVEPTYTNAPHMTVPTDDHAPSSVAGGQDFLRSVYLSLVGNPERWARAIMILTYDEHGGFFDHVSPISIRSEAPRGANYPAFDCSGVRVPGLVISPLVEEGAIYSKPLDHTSILSLLARKFGRGEEYSQEVAAREKAFTGRIEEMLSLGVARAEIVQPPGALTGVDMNTIAFQKAAAVMADLDPDKMTNKFPELRNFVKKV